VPPGAPGGDEAIAGEGYRSTPKGVIGCDEIWAFCYAKQKNVPGVVPGHVRLWRRVDVDLDLR